MLPKSAKCLLVILLTFSLGFHWAILQSVAWAGMVVKYSEKHSLSVAVQKTFNGKNPCKLCKFVSEGKQAEQKSEAKLDLKKLDSFTGFQGIAFYFPCSPLLVPPFDSVVADWLAAPPSPPPRMA